MKDADLQKIAAAIHPLVRSGNCVVWVGLGFSTCAHYLDWQELINKLCRACSVTPPDDLGTPNPLVLGEKADECKKANLSVYQQTLGDHFGRPPTGTRLAYGLIMKLPFRGYVTTNYDPLLAYAAAHNDRAGVYHFPDLPVTRLGGDTRPVYYIHGLARVNDQPCGRNLVLSKTEFHAAYEGIVGDFLNMLFTYHPVLFLGCRLQEPLIKAALGKAKRNQETIHSVWSTNRSPSKLILLAPRPIRERDTTGQDFVNHTKTEEAFEREKQELAQLNINVLRYHPKDESHYEIERILEHLCELEKVRVVPKPQLGLPEELPPP